MASPIPSDSTGFWVNPCGIEIVEEENAAVSDDELLEFLDDVILNSNICSLQAQELKQHMLESFVSLDEDSLRENFYDWLQLPNLDLESFATFDRDEALKDVYYLLQKFAVALDQMSMDQDENAEYHEFLRDSKIKITQLLCSLQIALMSLKVQPHPDATYHVMSDELRTLGEAGKLVRDYLIVRDYVKATSYTYELAKHFRGISSS